VFDNPRVTARPKIESDFLLDPADRALAVDTIALLWRFAQTPALAKLATPAWPRPRSFVSHAEIDAVVGKICGSGYHPCGTVPMGPEGAVDAAVDGRGRVRGVSGLYVADASIMPTIPSANTNLATLMIGERFGEWLSA